MFAHGLSITLTLAATLAASHPVSASNGPLSTFGELLKRRNIQLTQSALVDALKNADPEVRYLASQKLAEDKAIETIPAIKDALAVEEVPSTRMNIAFALAELGESTGFRILEDNCRNRDLGAGIRARSAEYMLRLGRESAICLRAVLDVLQTGSEGYRAEAATLLPRFHNRSAEDSDGIFVALVWALHASDASVRLEAGQSLADFGDRRAIPELRSAVANEQDPSIGEQLKRDLKILQEKARP